MARHRMPHVGRPSDVAITHNQMNDVFQAAANSQVISVTAPLTIQNTPGGGIRFGIILPSVSPAVAAVTEPVVMVQQFRIKSTTQSDVIGCVTWDGTTAGTTTIWVAKDWWTRGPDTWKNKTRLGIFYDNYNPNHQFRDATKQGVTERQQIVPRYVFNDIIVAMRAQTGVIVPGSDPEVEVKWVEPPGREWQVIE